MTVREVSKELSSHQGLGSPLVRMGSTTGLDAFLSNAHQFEVMYVGRIKGSSKQSSHTFLDDNVDRLKAKEAERLKQQKQQQQVSLDPSAARTGLRLNQLDGATQNLNNGFSTLVGKGPDVAGCRSSVENISISSPSSEFSSLENISEVSGADESCQQDGGAGNRRIQTPVVTPAADTQDPRELLLENLRSCAREDLNANPRDSLMPPSSHTLVTHTHSLDTPAKQALIQELRNAKSPAGQRVRSVSGDLPRPTKQTSLPTFRPRVSSGGAMDLRRALAQQENGRRNNRTMLFLILKRELCLLSTDRKQMLVNKPFSDISRCYLGIKHPDHFGFNCRDASLSSTDNYIAYIFKCSTVEVANEIMQTLKQAFHSAHQHPKEGSQGGGTPSSCPQGNQGLCDSCPMHRFHKLCLDLDGLSSDDCRSVIQRYTHQLSDSDKQIIAARYQVGNLKTVQEKNELYMMLLRNLYEQKQAKHTHSSSQGHKQDRKSVV